MLRVFYRARELNFDKLCTVYRESNARSGAEMYPNEEMPAALRQAENDFEAYIRQDFFRVPGAFYAVWEEDGDYRSALRMEPYRDGFLLTSLETDPGYRRRGYAQKLIRDVTAFADRPVYTHIHKQNKASIAVHQKCGFERILDYAVFLDGTVSQKAWTFCRK